MAAKTFTVRNNGSTTFDITRIQFNTPTGISHVADLSNLFTNGPQVFTEAIYEGQYTLAPAATRSFTVDHYYVSGPSSSTPREGTIVITGTGDRVATIQTNVRVNPATVPAYTLLRSVAEVDEGQSFTITLSTANVANGTTIPYTITGVSSADIGGAALSGVFTINNNSSSITFATTSDLAETTNETFTLSVPLANASVSVLIRNTSPAPGPTPPTPTPTPAPGPTPTPTPAPSPATYTLSVSPSSLTEGSTTPFTFTLQGTNIPSNLIGQPVNWRIRETTPSGPGVRAADPNAIPPVVADFNGTVSNGTLIGSVPLASPTTTIQVFSNNNRINLGNRTFEFSIPSGIGGIIPQPVSFTVNEAGAIVPQYSIEIAAPGPIVNEGTNVVFRVINTNQTDANGKQVNYIFDFFNGASTSDIGAVNFLATMTNYQSLVTVPVLADGWNNGQWTESANESFRIKIVSGSSVYTSPTVTINNTSRPNYQLTANVANNSTVNEGSGITFTFRDLNNITPGGLRFRYVLVTDLGVADFVSNSSSPIGFDQNGRLIGPAFGLDGNGEYSWGLFFANDFLTEGTQNLIVAIQQIDPFLTIPPYTSGAGITSEVSSVGPFFIGDSSVTPSFKVPEASITASGNPSYLPQVLPPDPLYFNSAWTYIATTGAFPVSTPWFTLRIDISTVNPVTGSFPAELIIATSGTPAIQPINQTFPITVVNGTAAFNLSVVNSNPATSQYSLLDIKVKYGDVVSGSRLFGVANEVAGGGILYPPAPPPPPPGEVGVDAGSGNNMGGFNPGPGDFGGGGTFA